MKLTNGLALLFLLVAPARAYEVGEGSALVCDTQRQAERFVQLFDQDLDRAIYAVNAEVKDPTACGVIDVAYVQGRDVGTARSKSHTFRIIPIVVIGEKALNGYEQVEPATFLMLIEIKEFAV